MKKYRHLTLEDRIYIEVWRWERRSLKYIASRLGFHPSTISRELRRGSSSVYKLNYCYRADLGEGRRRLMATKKGRKPKIRGEFGRLIVELIKRDWSPEQIAGRLKLERENHR